jgi:energy-coupling factor transporter transmembrane protein EcfT
VAGSGGGFSTAPEPEPEWPDRVTVTDGSPWLARATGAIPVDAALGQRTPKAIYLGQRLLYDKEPEPSFDPLSNRSLLAQFAVHFLVYFAAYWVLAVFFGIVLTILGLVAGLAVGWLLWAIGAGITGLLFGCLYWLIPVPALLSEWKFAIDAEGAVAPVTFEHISWAISRHETPLDSLQVRRLKFTGSESRDYLELRRGLFTGFISCFAHGHDLYIGWTLWVRLSPARWLLMAMARIWHTLMRRGTELHVTLRYESARALREAIHSVAREGVDVAIGQLHAQGAGSMAQIPVAVSEVDA